MYHFTVKFLFYEDLYFRENAIIFVNSRERIQDFHTKLINKLFNSHLES